MKGELTPVDRSEAVAVWIANASVIQQLKDGTIMEANIGSGQISATNSDGSTVADTFTGRLGRLPAGKIGYESKFEILHGTGPLKQATGRGEMNGVADPATLHFAIDVTGTLSAYGERRKKHENPKGDRSRE